MLTRRDIAIALTPAAIRGAVMVGGRIEKSERIRLDNTRWQEAWKEGLRPLDSALSALVQKLGAGPGSLVRLAYVGPRTRVDVCTVPARGQAALNAACLTATSNWPESRDALRAMDVLLEEPATKEQPARSHVLVMLEDVGSVNVLHAWIARAGLRCTEIAPSQGLAVRGALKMARGSGSSSPEAIVWIGEDVVGIVARAAGRVEVIRAVDLGFAPLVDAVMHAGAVAGRAIGPEEASRLLCTAGVPYRGQTMDAEGTLPGSAVLPLMQSVIQRLVVETKQTLRFALGEADAVRASVVLGGPGASIPGLGETLASQLDRPVALQSESNARGTDAIELGPLPDLLEMKRGTSLVPPVEYARRRQRGLLMCSACGLFLAAGLVSADALRTSREVGRLTAEMAALKPQLDDMEARATRRQQSSMLAGQLASLSKTASQLAGERAGWAAALGALSRAPLAGIELDDVSGSGGRDGSEAELVIHGRVENPAAEGGDVLGALLAEFTRSPLVDSARVGSTRTEMTEDGKVQRFSLIVKLRTLPSAVLAQQQEAP